MRTSRLAIGVASLPLLAGSFAGCSSGPEASLQPTQIASPEAAPSESSPADRRQFLSRPACIALKSLVLDFGFPSRSPLVDFIGETGKDGSVHFYGENRSYSVTDSARRIDAQTSDVQEGDSEVGHTLSTIIGNSKRISRLAYTAFEHTPNDSHGYSSVDKAPGFNQLEAVSAQTRTLALHLIQNECATPREFAHQ